RERPRRDSLLWAADLAPQRVHERTGQQLPRLDRILEHATLELRRAVDASQAVACWPRAEGVEKGHESHAREHSPEPGRALYSGVPKSTKVETPAKQVAAF